MSVVPRFEISGGRRLSGAIRPAGNKNAALAMLAATLLCDEPVQIGNVPRIDDVGTMLDLLGELGAEIERAGDNVTVNAARIAAGPISSKLTTKIRASLLLAGPLLARFGKVHLPAPGGDVIGRRRNDPHWDALRELGAEVAAEEDGWQLSRSHGRLRGADIWLDEMSVMATENVLLAAVTADGTTVVRNAASEPHVQDLCRLLVSMGAEIDGIGSNQLTVSGVERLHGASGSCGPDYIEVGSFVALAAVTDGELRIGPVRHDELTLIRNKLSIIGIATHADGHDLCVPSGQHLRVLDDDGGAIPRLHESPWPGFPADLMPITLVAATQAAGTVLLHQWMFESRLYFTDRLIEMGARIILADPHRAVVTGPAQLRGATLQSPDIRAGMAMLIAALCADGQSTIGNIGQIDRGYENIDARLRSLGATIDRIDD
jgi:UDP-N-acetylglucosamine 1-carboxyvinyltransferase